MCCLYFDVAGAVDCRCCCLCLLMYFCLVVFVVRVLLLSVGAYRLCCWLLSLFFSRDVFSVVICFLFGVGVVCRL